MLTAIFEWLDNIFETLEKRYPEKQSHKVTPQYILHKYRNYLRDELPPENSQKPTEIIRAIR